LEGAMNVILVPFCMSWYHIKSIDHPNYQNHELLPFRAFYLIVNNLEGAMDLTIVPFCMSSYVLSIYKTSTKFIDPPKLAKTINYCLTAVRIFFGRFI